MGGGAPEGFRPLHISGYRPKAVELAIFFHDAIYSPRAGSPKNEKDSAVLFDRYAQEGWHSNRPSQPTITIAIPIYRPEDAFQH